MMDADGNGEIDKDEFLVACQEVPPILDCFNQCLSPAGTIKPYIMELKELVPTFGITTVFTVWDNIGSDRVRRFRIN